MNRSKINKWPIHALNLHIENFQQRIVHFKQSENTNNVVVKPLRSAKNLQELKTFDFDDQNLEIINTQRKLIKLRKLELERQHLMQSLEILKESAVSAIAEKFDEIEKLKAKQSMTIDEKLQLYEKELFYCQKLKKQLQEEKQDMQKEFCEERDRYISMLSQKQYQIESLHEQLLEIRKELYNMEQKDAIKSRKVKILQEENHKLSRSLQEMNLSSIVRSNIERNNDDALKTISSLSLNASACFSASDSMKNYMFSESDQILISQKVEEISKIHKEQMNELRNYYEKRIAYLREIYQRQLPVPTQENQKQSAICRPRSISKTSRQSKSINMKDMYAIQEQAEQMFESVKLKRNDLKHQIKQHNLDQFQNEDRRRTNEQEDTQSQFTMKYFENPFYFMKKNNSLGTIEVASDHQVKTTLKIKDNSTQEYENKVTQHQDDTQNSKQSNNSTNKQVFTIGLLSGVFFGSLAGIVYKKFD